MPDTTLDINRNALKINVSQYGWTSVEVARVDLLADYLNQAFALLQEIKDFQGEYDSFFDIYDQVTAMYNELTVKLTDFNTKYPVIVNLHSEIVRLHAEVQRNAETVNITSVRVSADASEVALSRGIVEGLQDQVATDADEVSKLYAEMIVIVEELKKGNVYRGTWNPHSGAYPTNHSNTNSTWDVVLNPGETQYNWGGKTWYWGDRLIYLAADGSYSQIETGSSVVSVNNKTGAVRLDISDIYHDNVADTKLSIEDGSRVVTSTGQTITDLKTKVDNIVGGAIVSEHPPVDPKEGVTWFCTTDARTYIWFRDEDGTTQWVDQNPDRIIIENIGGVPLLSTMWFPSREMIAPGYIPADGQLVSKALYDAAWDKVRSGTVPTVPDAAWLADPLSRGGYTTGTDTQFRVPDYNGRSPGSAGAPFQRGDGTGINHGRITESQNKAHTHTRGDMNITGNFGSGVSALGITASGGGADWRSSGAFSLGRDTKSTVSAATSGTPDQVVSVTLDASKSWTGKTSSDGGIEARPLNVTGVWAIKVYDQLLDPSILDVNETLTELALLKADIANYQGAGVPVGTIQWFSTENMPMGYLLCDGRQVSRASYPDLYDVLKDTYGPGDGTSSFHLPDLINEFIRGYSPTSRPVGTKQGDAIRKIYGKVYGYTEQSASGRGFGFADGVFLNTTDGTHLSSPQAQNNYTNGGALVFDSSRTMPTAEEFRPTNISLLPMIKAYSHIINPGALDVADIELRLHNLEGHWENSREICLVNATGTGHPHELVSADLPPTITGNTRYIIQNPFGKNTPVLVIAEILVNGSWCDPQFVLADSNFGYGVKATYKQQEGIILQTGGATSSLVVQNNQCGSGHASPPAVTTAPCRIRVIKTV